jgi:hypothetical protein
MRAFEAQQVVLNSLGKRYLNLFSQNNVWRTQEERPLCLVNRLKKRKWELERETGRAAFSSCAMILSYAAVRLYRNHSAPWREICILHAHNLPESWAEKWIICHSSVNQWKSWHTIFTMHRGQFFFCGRTPDPVPPLELGFDDLQRLVTWVVTEVLQKYPSRQKREVNWTLIISVSKPHKCVHNLHTNFNPYARRVLVPVENANDLTDDCSNKTIPVEEVEN